MKRGEIWWANFPHPIGRRPALVVQSDAYNDSTLRSVVLVPITSNLKLAELEGNVLLPAAEVGLPRDSVAHVTQVAALDKSDLTERVSRVPQDLFHAVEDGLRLVLDL